MGRRVVETIKIVKVRLSVVKQELLREYFYILEEKQ